MSGVGVESEAQGTFWGLLLFCPLSAAEKSIQVCSYLCSVAAYLDGALEVSSLFNADLTGG